MGQRPHAEYREAQTGLTEEEKSASLFQPDILVSGEYFRTLRRKTFLQPEKKLMLAILEDAINCVKDNSSAQTGKDTRIFREAEQWVLGVGDDWLFGFESICETLELNPEYMRNGLLRRKEKELPNQRNAPAGTVGVSSPTVVRLPNLARKAKSYRRPGFSKTDKLH